ncbi:8-amino-7-oxononanoate synthase [Thiogranum longum]|uniref:8-amino-7-oxononanoate synthase n=1 Tax=Thiogranum longum TaxID=1537524 RepID=A0A4R1HCW3_9GAMM|nr:8-amino-7-oxononanoate synthase [Thiogranum longum]TCK17069.1 8-amino-7-oxononanoate synthase [Thiogranum longum]
MRDLVPALERRRQQHLYRQRQTLGTPQGVEITVDGTPYLSFCSNDYLGLANHPALVRALAEGARRFGVGSGAAHLITGHSYAHQALEEDLAAFTGRPRALLFSTGYMANLGIASALLRRGDTLVEDRLNHASLIDAAQLSGARLVRYRHTDMDSLARRLSGVSSGDTLVATDAVFSMDGDCAPLADMQALCNRHDAWLLADDAHGFGVLGEQGGGWLKSQVGEGAANTVLMATLGKALGTFGAFVAGSDALIETLVQQSRTYVYTTATPPAVAWATRTALRLVREGDDLRTHLNELIKRFRTAAAQLELPLMASLTPIQPLQVGDAAMALGLGDALRRQGILAGVIRPPTVPEGAARLRITLSAQHTPEQVDRLLDVLGKSYREVMNAAS